VVIKFAVKMYHMVPECFTTYDHVFHDFKPHENKCSTKHSDIVL